MQDIKIKIRVYFSNTERNYKESGPRTKYRYGAGLDIHKYYVTACVVSESDGTFIKVAVQEFSQTPDGLQQLGRFLSKYLLRVIVLEATGVYSTPVHALLVSMNDWGHSRPAIRVINPSCIRKYTDEKHADRNDAFDLAIHGLAGLAKGSYIPLDALAGLRCMTREIDRIERDCTRIKNRMKKTLSQYGLAIRNLDMDTNWSIELFRAIDQSNSNFGLAIKGLLDGTFPASKWSRSAIARRKSDLDKFESIVLPSTAVIDIRMKLLNLAGTRVSMNAYIAQIESICSSNPDLARAVKRLAEVPSIDTRTAAGIIAEIGDAHRFPNKKCFLQYSGCAPTIHQSGEKTMHGHLNKRANMWLKRRLFMAGKIVCSLIKEDSFVKEHARAMLNRYWDRKKLAWVHVGIKIAGIVYGMLRNNSDFRNTVNISMNTPACEENSTIKSIALTSLREKTSRYVRFVKRLSTDGASDLPDDIMTHLKEIITFNDKSEREAN